MRKKRCDHVTALLIQLHWLPVQYRIRFKVLPLVYKALYADGPVYIKQLLSEHTLSRSLRSCNKNCLDIPRTRLKTYGDRAFSVIGPILWNELPANIKNSESITIFKISLKTHLFREFLLMKNTDQ